MNTQKINIAIFASGNGTNAQAILEHFNQNDQVNITCIYSNNASAYVLKRGKNFGTKTFVFSKDDFYRTNKVTDHLQEISTDIIVLAGFMWLVPSVLVDKYTIINIHPALLPNYGGKGMYGHFVHEAVIKNREKESGITIHYVSTEYDKGSIILQEKCPIIQNDTPETLADKIHKLEHQHYPKTISEIVQKILSQEPSKR